MPEVKVTLTIGDRPQHKTIFEDSVNEASRLFATKCPQAQTPDGCQGSCIQQLCSGDQDRVKVTFSCANPGCITLLVDVALGVYLPAQKKAFTVDIQSSLGQPQA